ncbi:aminodeoxychorismate lyase [Catenovulum adriaticum]|uniref:Aminodeoxychorismate lyase n=1 Tax=Catenovulum adriaticum TaxID=2984846 RepID=A0ABY7ANC9_9ALTE|nr:aminodeoxychorismate lyase [Catenovulum sp. TS8]WAJ71019.1 aminodeoxychorismate lyase [Catenovulum sp. TS8]
MKLIQVNSNHHQISALNRAFQFGDGHFTTLLIKNQQIQLWAYHKARLKQANTRLFFPRFGFKQLEQQLSIIANNKTTPQIVKILVSRGQSQRGYAIPNDIEAEVFLYCSDYHSTHFKYPSGIDLAVLKTQTAQQADLAGLKHCNRLEQVLIKRELSQLMQTDGLVLDRQQHIIETSLANIFLYINHQWCTPSLELSGVEGVMRAYVLDWFKQQNVNCQIRPIAVNELAQTQAGFITNALLGCTPIAQIANQEFDLTLSQQFVEPVNETIF